MRKALSSTPFIHAVSILIGAEYRPANGARHLPVVLVLALVALKVSVALLLLRSIA